MDKKGQGLSLNVIIIAALALIVLVILVAIFTGRIGRFDTGVSEVGDTELARMRVQYGVCHPAAVAETKFRLAFNGAESLEEQDQLRSDFEVDEVDRCASILDKGLCEEVNCKWK